MTIEELIKILPFFAGEEWNITPLNGWSNHTYRVTSKNKRYVVRIPAHEQAPWISWLNREREYAHLKMIAPFHITPDTIYFDASTGICVREYIPGDVVSDDSKKITEADLSGMASILKRLHETPVNFFSIPIFDVLFRDMKIVEDHFSVLDARYEILKKYTQKVKPLCAMATSVPCHMDPNPNNFLKTEKEMLLLDFEYAAGCDVAWDLAYTITYANLSATQEKYFLGAYAADAVICERVIFYKPLTQWMQAIWIRLQFVLGNYPVSEAEMLRWEENALEKAVFLINDLNEI